MWSAGGHFYMIVCKEHPDIASEQITLGNMFNPTTFTSYSREPQPSPRYILGIYYIIFSLPPSYHDKKDIEWPNQCITVIWKECLSFIYQNSREKNAKTLSARYFPELFFKIVLKIIIIARHGG